MGTKLHVPTAFAASHLVFCRNVSVKEKHLSQCHMWKNLLAFQRMQRQQQTQLLWLWLPVRLQQQLLKLKLLCLVQMSTRLLRSERIAPQCSLPCNAICPAMQSALQCNLAAMHPVQPVSLLRYVAPATGPQSFCIGKVLRINKEHTGMHVSSTVHIDTV